MKTKPEPSLCDTCLCAYIVEGGRTSCSGIGQEEDYACPQRYCSELKIAIHFNGKQKCDKYDNSNRC